MSACIFCMKKQNFSYVPVLGHIAANTVSVVREETGWLSFGYTTDAKGIGFTAVMLVVAGAVIWGSGSGRRMWNLTREPETA